MIERRNMDKHSKIDCIWRMKACEHCEEEFLLCLEKVTKGFFFNLRDSPEKCIEAQNET